MIDLWTTLIPLVIASALLPLQITVTILLAQAAVGRIAAAAWVAGMLIVRIGQGVVFGLFLSTGVGEAEGPDRPGPIASTFLLVVGVLLVVSALRGWLKEPDEDAPPPRWMTRIDSATPGQALIAGAAIVLVSAKLWVFTLGAIAVIAEAELALTEATGVYLVFTILAMGVHVAIVGLTYLWPTGSTAILARLSDALARHARLLKIAIGLVFGTWFFLKGLAGLGLI